MVFYFSLLVLPGLLFYFAFGLHQQGLDAFNYPWQLGTDYMWTLAALKGLAQGDWSVGGFFKSERLAAPFGFSQGDFPGTDQWNLIIIQVISYFTKNPYAIANWFYVGGFSFSALGMGLFLRKLDLSRISSMVGGLCFAFLPFHFYRLEHLFLSQYSILPLIFYVFWIYWREECLNLFKLKNFLLLFGFSFLCVGTGIYYAFFTCYFFTVITLLKAFRRLDSPQTIKGYMFEWAMVVGLFVLQTIIQLLPFLLYRVQKTEVIAGPTRAYSESLYFALRLKNILLPMSDHRLEFLSELKRTYGHTEFWIKIPVVEGFNEYIGILGVVGFFLSFYYVFKYFRNGAVTPIKVFAVLLVSGVALGFPLGVGFWFNYLISPQIRCYNRISIFIAGFAITVALLAYQQWIQRKPQSHFWKFFPLMLLPVFLLDQISPKMKIRPYQERTVSDQNFFEGIERQIPSGSNILQLPYIPFPESRRLHQLDNYGHFRAYINSHYLKWSFGAHKERAEGKFISELSRNPIDISRIKAAKYSGICIDRLGYADGGEAIVQELKNLGYVAEESSNRDLVFFNLNQK